MVIDSSKSNDVPSDSNPPPNAADLLPLVYDELRGLAVAYLHRERANHTLQPTALVHEAYARLADRTRGAWKTRADFVAVAAATMRRVLVDHARRVRAQKRGGNAGRIALTDAMLQAHSDEVDLLALDEALCALASLNERQSRVVELRFFGGLSVDETAEVLEVSPRTVDVDWSMARAWLRRALGT